MRFNTRAKKVEFFSLLQHLINKKHGVLFFLVTAKKKEWKFEFEKSPIILSILKVEKK